MAKQYLEPMSRKDKTSHTKISLRGSVAESYRVLLGVSEKSGNDYIGLLLSCDHDGLIKTYHKGVVIIGLLDETGKFPPDW